MQIFHLIVKIMSEEKKKILEKINKLILNKKTKLISIELPEFK